MINISEATAIGLHAMIFIANGKGKIYSLKEIASTFNVSENHLSKVLQKLVKAGYLQSVKGPKGGFRIVKGKENLTLMDIYEVTEGKYMPKNCLFSSKHFSSCCCIMRPLISSMNNVFEEFMINNKINEFKF